MEAGLADTGHDEQLIRSAEREAGRSPIAPAARPGPERFPGYQVIREIRGGGQGVVYQAVHEATDLDVAIKVFHVRDGTVAGEFDRFVREADSLRAINHANVVAIHEAGVAGRTPYIVMAYVEGCSLDEFVASRPLDQSAAMRIFERLCDGVHAAHVRGVIHRDLKPGNIRIDDHDEPRLLDFGIAKVLGPAEAGDTLTHTGQFLGTLPWASPEQVDSRPDGVDARTDVYALGALLFYMLTGRPPIDLSGSDRDVLNRIVTLPPLRPRDLRPEIRDDVQTIILKCLAKEKERRYQSASELGAEARRWLDGKPIEAKRESVLYVAGKWSARHRVAVAVTLTAVIAVTSLVAREASRARAREAIIRSVESHLSATNQPEIDRVALDKLRDVASRLGPRDQRDHARIIFEVFTATANRNTVEGDWDQAADNRARALREAIQGYGEGSAHAVQCRISLAHDAMWANRLTEAEHIAREAVRLADSLSGRDAGARPADALSILAWVLIKTDRLDEAAGTLQASADAARAVPRLAAGNLAGHLKKCAELFLDNGLRRRQLGMPAAPMFAEAEGLHREAIGLARGVWARDEATLAHYVHSYSVFLRETGRLAEAERLAHEALDIRSRLIKPDAYTSYLLRASQNTLGVIRMEQGRYTDAEQLLLEAFNGLNKGPNTLLHDLRKEFAGNLSELHARWALEEPARGHQEASRRWRQMAGEKQDRE